MAYEERLQSDGQIYTNNYKANDKQPDWTGKVTIQKELLKSLVSKIKETKAEDVEVRVALWNRVSKHGNEYKYARLDLPQEQKKPEPEPEPDFNDDDIPF